MVNQVLEMSRQESQETAFRFCRVNLRDLAEDILLEMKPLAIESGVALINEMPPDLPEVLADRDRLGRVVMNLIDNALKFTPAGGQVWVHGQLHIADGTWVQCVVLDTGPGLPIAGQEGAIKRFADVEGRAGRRPGTGLGLGFCQFVVQAHGGELWAESRPEGGSAFGFALPVE
jgi:signal transduction histidine kinase